MSGRIARRVAGLHSVQPGGGVDHQPVQPCVRAQQIGAVADDQGPGAAGDGVVQQQHQLLPPLRKGHPAGGAADAEGGVAAHGLVTRHPQVRQIVCRPLV